MPATLDTSADALDWQSCNTVRIPHAAAMLRRAVCSRLAAARLLLCPAAAGVPSGLAPLQALEAAAVPVLLTNAFHSDVAFGWASREQRADAAADAASALASAGDTAAVSSAAATTGGERLEKGGMAPVDFQELSEEEFGTVGGPVPCRR